MMFSAGGSALRPALAARARAASLGRYLGDLQSRSCSSGGVSPVGSLAVAGSTEARRKGHGAAVAPSTLGRAESLLSRRFFASSPASSSSRAPSPTPSPSSHVLSDGPAPGRPQLVRDFIGRALYSKESGYFVATDCVFSSPPIPFTTLRGTGQYEQEVRKRYEMTKDGWITPVELFKPYYGHAIARWILSQLLPSVYNPRAPVPTAWPSSVPSTLGLSARALAPPLPQLGRPGVPVSHLEPPFPLRIVEVGGGKGACANDVLGYLQTYAPNVYRDCLYTVIELSPTLSDKQCERINPAHGDHFR